MEILEVLDDSEKRYVTRYILESLTEWFGILEAREEYIRDSVGKTFFSAYNDDKPIGFLYLKQTGKDTAELAVMGVLKEFHRNGIGKSLFECAKKHVAKRDSLLFKLKLFKWGNMRIMIKQTDFIFLLDLKNLRYFQRYGTNGIRVKYM